MFKYNVLASEDLHVISNKLVSIWPFLCYNTDQYYEISLYISSNQQLLICLIEDTLLCKLYVIIYL